MESNTEFSCESGIIRLRPMQSADLDTFLKLGCRTCGSLHGRPSQSEADLFERFRGFVKEFAFRPESEIWIASADTSEYVGHMWLYVTTNRFNGNRELWIWDLSVAPERQNRGIGKIMVKFAQRRAAELHCPELWLLVAENNDVAKHVYASSGMAPKARMMEIDL